MGTYSTQNKKKKKERKTERDKENRKSSCMKIIGARDAFVENSDIELKHRFKLED